MDSEHRRNPRPFNLMTTRGRPAFPRRGLLPAPLQTLAAPFRGAKSSHNFRAAPRGRPAFPRRDLLPAPCKPLQLRSGEQILHTVSAPPIQKSRSTFCFGDFPLLYLPLFIHFQSLGFRIPKIVLYQVDYRAGKQEYRNQVRDNHQTVEGIRQRPEQAQVHGGTDDCHQRVDNNEGFYDLRSEEVFDAAGAVQSPTQDGGEGKAAKRYRQQDGNPSPEGGGETADGELCTGSFP